MTKMLLGGIVLGVVCAANVSAANVDANTSEFSILNTSNVATLSDEAMGSTYGKHLTITNPAGDSWDYYQVGVHIKVNIGGSSGPTVVDVDPPGLQM